MKYVLIYDHEGIDGQRVRMRNRQGISKWHSIFSKDCQTLDTPLQDHIRESRFCRADTNGSF